MAKKLNQQDLLKLPSIGTPNSDSVAFAAKSDGLYQKVGTTESKLSTTAELLDRVKTPVPEGAKFTDTNTVYTHPTSEGNKHIPSGGASNQILRYSAPGTAFWSTENNTTYTAGTNIQISGTNVISATDTKYSLPTASGTVLGGVKIGSNISISSGVISVAAPYTHPSSHPATMITGLHTSATTGVAGSVAWGNVTEKPSTFAPSTHTHSNITITAGTGLSGGGALSASRTLSIASTYAPNTSTSLGASKNLNNYQTAGFYHQTANANATTALNYPVASAGALLVETAAGVIQTYKVYNSSDVYVRGYYSTTWSDWRKLVNASDSIPWARISGAPATATTHPTWAQVTGKPTTFAPSGHNHTVAQITNFPTKWAWADLSGVPTTFAPSAHSHGNITNDGKIGATTNLMIQTSTGGVLVAKTAGTTAQYLRGDGAWGTPPNTNTTYSAMSVAEGTTGTATSLRTMRADYLKQIIQYYDTNTTYTAGTNIQISETNVISATDTKYTHPSGIYMSSAERTKLSGIATGANNYTLPVATATVRGGVELFSNTVQSVAANAVTTTASRTYGIQLNSAGQAVVNVPWSNTNTTYSAGTGLSLSGTTFGQAITTNGSGSFVTGITQTTNGFQVNLGTPPNTTYSAGTLALLQTGTNTSNRVWSSKILNDWLNPKLALKATPADITTAIDGIEIGGVNLVRNTGFTSTDGWVDPDDAGLGVNGGRNGLWFGAYGRGAIMSSADNLISLKAGSFYTISYEIQFPYDEITSPDIRLGFSRDGLPNSTAPGANISLDVSSQIDPNLTDEWQTVKGTVQATHDVDTCAYLYFGGSYYELWIRRLKIEKGTITTDWSPAPEDVQAEIDDMEIGGRNLIPNSNAFVDIGVTDVVNGVNFRRVGNAYDYEYNFSLPKGTYTLSVLAYNPHNVVSRAALRFVGVSYTEMQPKEVKLITRTVTFTYGPSGVINMSTNSGYEPIAYSYIKLEKGNKATDWTPAPEDLVTLDTFQTITGNKTFSTLLTANAGINTPKVNFGNGFTIEASGTELVFKYQNVIKQRMLSDGTILATGGITALTT